MSDGVEAIRDRIERFPRKFKTRIVGRAPELLGIFGWARSVFH